MTSNICRKAAMTDPSKLTAAAAVNFLIYFRGQYLQIMTRCYELR